VAIRFGQRGASQAPEGEMYATWIFPFFFFPFSGILMPVLIVAIVFWYKAREREIQAHQELRMREMEHQRKMKELEIELEKAKARQASERSA